MNWQDFYFNNGAQPQNITPYGSLLGSQPQNVNAPATPTPDFGTQVKGQSKPEDKPKKGLGFWGAAALTVGQQLPSLLGGHQAGPSPYSQSVGYAKDALKVPGMNMDPANFHSLLTRYLMGGG